MGAREFFVSIGNSVVAVDLSSEGIVRIGDRAASYSLTQNGRMGFQLIVDGRVYRVQTDCVHEQPKLGERFGVSINGNRYQVVVDDKGTKLRKSFEAKSTHHGGTTTVKAPMPGLVTKIEVSKGDHVVPGQGLIILEAMKMENEIRSTAHGNVTEILVEAGRPVEKGEILLTVS